MTLLIFANILGLSVIRKLTTFLVVILNGYIWNIILLSIIKKQIFIEEYLWIQIHDFVAEMHIIGDFLALSMSLLVTTITSCIIIYSLDYIKEDPALIRFVSYLFLFLFSMLLMVTAGNYIQFFVGWEYVGLTSYLLINFWFTRNDANRGALKAIIYNRVGDVSFLCAICYIYLLYGTFNFSIVFTIIPTVYNLDNTLENFSNIRAIDIEIVALFLLVAAAAKSAQLFLHSWLVDAMEGPTPVSALLHSATMVTAGIFLILRSNTIFSYSPSIMTTIILLGTLTMLVSSFIALTQNDIKRIVAFSTCSQLGLMMVSAGFGCYIATYFHLITHAFFKSALFLSCGIIIHSLQDEQDIRKMGKLILFAPMIYTGTLICSLSLIGVPMLGGYFSKDLILETLFTTHSQYAAVIFFLGCFGALLTTVYSIRFIYLIFLYKKSFGKNTIKNQNLVQIPPKMLYPFYILIGLSMVSGYILEKIFSNTTILFANNLTMNSTTEIFDSEFEITNVFKAMPLMFTILALIIIGLNLYISNIIYTIKLYYYKIFILSAKKYFFDSFYNKMITKPVLIGAYQIFYKLVDKGFLEYFGPTGIFHRIVAFKNNTDYLHNSYNVTYILLLSYYCTIMLFTLVYFSTYF